MLHTAVRYQTDSQTLLKCLGIVSELLTEPRFKKLTPALQTLMETLVIIFISLIANVDCTTDENNTSLQS